MKDLVFFAAAASAVLWEIIYGITGFEPLRWLAYLLLFVSLLTFAAQIMEGSKNGE